MITWKDLINILHYDSDTGIFTWKIKVGNRPTIGKVAGGLNVEGYRRITIQGKEYLEHRLAWFYCFKEWPNSILDHIDRNKVNNAIDNLREATNSENLRNASISKLNTTGYKGVSYYARTGKYQAKIWNGNKREHLGYFITPEEAGEAYKKFAKLYYKEFGSTGG